MNIEVVPDAYGACPRCGAYWGHPDKTLDFPNRNKVDNLWRCYNPACTAGYYDPATNTVAEEQATPEEEAASRERARQYVADLMVGKKWERTVRPDGIEISTLVDK